MADSEPSSDRRDAGIRAARALGDSRNYRGAVAALRDVLSQHPDHVEAHYLLGLYLHNLGLYPDAVAACRAAVALDPADAIAHRLLGIVLGAWPRRKSEALNHLDQAVRLSPADGFNHFYRARALAALGRRKDARAAFLGACERGPSESQILAGTAEFLFATCEIRKAQEFAARAFAAAPDDLVVLSVEARSRLVAGRAADARDLARAAVALHATHRPAVAALIEAEMCRNPVFALWSRLKNWCLGGKLRAAVLLIAWCQVVSLFVMTVAIADPDASQPSILAFAACVVLPMVPGLLFRRRLAAALKPVRLKRQF